MQHGFSAASLWFGGFSHAKSRSLAERIKISGVGEMIVTNERT